MSFSRSTSSHYAPSSQSSPQRPFVANSGNSSSNNNNNNSSSGGNAMATPTTAPQSYSTRPPLYIPSHGHHNSQHQIPLQPPPPASAPSNQQHFNLSSGYQNQQQQHHQQQQQHQQQPGGRLAPFGHRASYSGGGGGGAGQGMLPLQRSLSPPPHGRRYLPVPGRYDIGGKLQRSPLPFPRIPSPKLQQRQQQQQGMMHQQHQQQHQPQQRLSPPSATAPLATVVANAAGNSSGGAGNSITAHSPARESTRRLSSVVWGPTGFERLESGMSRCRICHKEYSKGSSTGTLKRHFRQHQVNVGPGGSYARRSPPVTASVASATSVAASAAATAVATTPTSAPAVHHVQRPRAYSHRTETRTNREASPLLSAPRLHFQQNQLQQNQLQQNLRVGSADVDSSSAIAGSALLSMAAGDSRMDVDTRPVRRPTRLSDPSVYPAPSSAGATTIDPETRDISVSPSPSTAASARDDARQTVRTVQIPQLPPPKMETGSDSDSESDNDSHASQRPHKRRRATDASAHSIARTTSPGLLPSGALSAAELVALSSELMLRVAQALPTLALEAADSQRASDACRTGDPLDVLLGHIRTRLLADSSESVPRLNGSGSAGVGAVPSSGSPHNTKTPLWSPRPASPPSSSSSALLSPFYSLLSASTNRLPFTVRKAHPRPVTTTATMTLLSRVSAAMQRIAPLSLAELKWDNVGILLEAAQPRTAASRVFLTIDLTSETLREALDDPAVGVIVAYHPPIFSAWKSLTMSDNKQSLILRCASAGVSIYTPHTSLDSCEDGINDWLAASVGEGAVVPITPASPEVAAAAGQHNAGSGRLVTLATPLPLSAVVERVKQRLGLERIRVARASCHDGPSDTQTLVSRVAVCAGSGYSVVSAATTTTSSPKVDVYLTGEMGHHDALAATAAGTSCILGEHSNTERGYLRAVLAERLQRELDTDNGDSDSGSVSVVVSLVDKDPISIE
ncbi:hypothetical protein H4217_003510 [Coemansia sp. RSA 1939]|nr:hypothetical protein H4217_003510 [Coemansia sp. RSA 1939]